MRKISSIVIHHSVSPRDQDLEKSIASFDKNHAERLHTTKNKLGYHIAYHYVVAGNGTYKKTRMWDEVGFHGSNLKVNNESIGICLTGNFDIEQPTRQQYDAVKKIIAEIRVVFPNVTIHGHNEYASKSCPGHNFDFNQLQNVLMLFYEKLRKENIEKLPEDQRAVKDPKKAIERISKLSTPEIVSELIYFVSVVTQNTMKKNNVA